MVLGGRGAPGRAGAGRIAGVLGHRGVAAGVVAGFGTVLLVRHLLGEGAGLGERLALGAPLVVVGVGLVCAGVWLLRCDLPDPRVGRVALWSALGFLAPVAVAAWILPGGSAGVALPRAALVALDAGGVGATAGLLCGLYGEQRRALRREPGRPALGGVDDGAAFFDRLLRHHLLNGVAVIRGHAELLAEEADEPPRRLELIRRRSDELVEVVRNVGTLWRAAAGDLPRGPVDPIPPLVDAVEAARRARPEATIDLDLDRGNLPRRDVRVVGNDHLRLVFGDLVESAIDDAAGTDLAVSLTVESAAVEVHVETAGQIPLDAAPPADRIGHGDGDLRRVLAEALLEHCGGELVVEGGSGEAGALVVRLRRAGTPP